jgi:hypothetical protein
MKHGLMILGAAALVAASGPAFAKPNHGNHGNHGNHSSYAAGNHGNGKYYAYGRNSCPPGLAKKNNGCMPRGQYKKMYQTGQRFNANYGSRWSYNQIPSDLRSRYDFNPNYRYYYSNGYLYQVNPTTMLVQQVVNAILR